MADQSPLVPVVRAAALSKALGFAVAYAAGGTSFGERTGLAYLIKNRSCFASLGLYLCDDVLGTIATEAIIIAGESAALHVLGFEFAGAAAFSDTLLTAPFVWALRRIVSPIPNVDRYAAPASLNLLTPREMGALAAVQGLRALIRSVVTLGRRYWGGSSYLKPAAVAVQSAVTALDAAVVSLAALRGTAWVMQRSRFSSSYWTWALVYGGLWSAGCGVSSIALGKLNASLQRVTASMLYDKTPGVRNPHQPLFDVRQLERQFGHLSSNELARLSEFANEALRSAAINQNTRLHAIRYLASLTSYVKAVNSGALTRNVGRQPPPQFAVHEFTNEQLARSNALGTAPFACAACTVDFVPLDHAYHLPCGHLVHAPTGPSAHRTTGLGRRCSDLPADWCPACICPVITANKEERLEIFVNMRSYVETLAAEWQTCQIVPASLNAAEWGYVAQFARRHMVVEGEVPLDVVPYDHQPGVTALLDLPMLLVLWALRLAPSDSNPKVFVLAKGW